MISYRDEMALSKYVNDLVTILGSSSTSSLIDETKVTKIETLESIEMSGLLEKSGHNFELKIGHLTIPQLLKQTLQSRRQVLGCS